MSRSLSPVRRTARLLRLLRQPIALPDLQAQLDISPAQLRRDLHEIEEEGYQLGRQEGGPHQPKMVWLLPG